MMTEVALMIEGQMGLNWPRWQRITQVAEDSGYIGLYRSDHFTNPNTPDQDSLDLWASLVWLASHTERIEFGPLVSPVSFRHPVHTARMAAAVDDLSGGRLVLGMGAGWQEREHHNYGFDLLELPARFARFEEGLEVVTRLLNRREPVNFDGKYYSLNEAILLPAPRRDGGPPVLIGGNGPRYTLPLVAQYADEWNAVLIGTEDFKILNARLDKMLEAQGRRPETVRRSLMTGCVFGRNDQAIERKARLYGGGKYSPEDLRERGMIVGRPEQVRDQLTELGEAGVQRVMLQWLDMDDLRGMEELAQALDL
jgi:F420-dependent oxidoreductase-like protein